MSDILMAWLLTWVYHLDTHLVFWSVDVTGRFFGGDASNMIAVNINMSPLRLRKEHLATRSVLIVRRGFSFSGELILQPHPRSAASWPYVIETDDDRHHHRFPLPARPPACPPACLRVQQHRQTSVARSASTREKRGDFSLPPPLPSKLQGAELSSSCLRLLPTKG